MKKQIKVGDRVMYSAEFCRNTGQITGDIPFARGVVKAVLLKVGDHRLLAVDWRDENIPTKVLDWNLEVCK